MAFHEGGKLRRGVPGASLRAERLPCSKTAITATQIALERGQHLHFHALAADYSVFSLIVSHRSPQYARGRGMLTKSVLVCHNAACAPPAAGTGRHACVPDSP